MISARSGTHKEALRLVIRKSFRAYSAVSHSFSTMFFGIESSKHLL